MRSELNIKIESLIIPFMKELDTELVALNVKYNGDTKVLDVVTDKCNGGITIGECSSINKKIVRGLGDHHSIGSPSENQGNIPAV